MVDPTPLKLRETLGRADAALASAPPAVARRVRILLTEVIGRSSDPRRQPRGPISIDIDIMDTAVRVDLSGPALVSRAKPAAPTMRCCLPGFSTTWPTAGASTPAGTMSRRCGFWSSSDRRADPRARLPR
jgi:hypothetical protein